MTTRPLIGFALMCAATVACTRDPQVLKQKYFKSGNEYYAKQQYAEATVQYSNALHQDPMFGEARFKLAESYKALGNVRAAFPEYIRAADLLPNNDDAQLKAGTLLVNGGFFAEAKNRARTVLRRNPQNVTALVLLGNALAGLKDLDEGVGVITRAVQVDPELAGVYANLGVFQLQKGDNELAERAFQKAVSVAPKSIEAHLNLGSFYRALRRWPDAERVFKTALELDSRNTKVNDAIASMYVESGRAAQAEPYFKALVAYDKNEQAYFALAGYYVSVGRLADAERTLDELAADKKHYATARTRIAMIRFLAGDRPRAHQIIDEVLQKEPRSASAMTVKARLLAADKRTSEALERIKLAIMIDPRSADAQLTLARIQLTLNNIEEARKAFNDTLKLDPHSMAASLELSELHRNRNEMDTAIQFAEQALVGNSDSVVARMTLVRALMVRDEDHERAEKELQTLISRHPESARAQGILAQLLLNRNELAGAERIFTQELKLDPQSVEAMTGLVAIDLSRKRTAEARARVDAFLAKHPQSASALVIAAKVYREAGDPAKVEQLLTRALAADASNPAIYALLAEHYISQKRLGEAHKQFAAIVKLQPRSVAANTMMGLICYAEGNLDDAQRWWEKTLQIDAYAAAAANNLAWLYAEGRGNLEVALQLAQTAKSKYPTLPEVNDTLGWVYYRKDLIAQATLYLQQSLDLDPNNPTYHYHLGMAYARKGDDAKARRLLEAALRLDPKLPEASQAKKTLATLVY